MNKQKVNPSLKLMVMTNEKVYLLKLFFCVASITAILLVFLIKLINQGVNGGGITSNFMTHFGPIAINAPVIKDLPHMTDFAANIILVFFMPFTTVCALIMIFTLNPNVIILEEDLINGEIITHEEGLESNDDPKTSNKNLLSEEFLNKIKELIDAKQCVCVIHEEPKKAVLLKEVQKQDAKKLDKVEPKKEIKQKDEKNEEWKFDVIEQKRILVDSEKTSSTKPQFQKEPKKAILVKEVSKQKLKQELVEPISTESEIEKAKKDRKTYPRVSKKELVEDIFVANGEEISKAKIRKAINNMFEVIEANMINEGSELEIQNFARFTTVQKPEVVKLNPLTGEKITIAAKKTIKFKPAKALKESVN